MLTQPGFSLPWDSNSPGCPQELSGDKPGEQECRGGEGTHPKSGRPFLSPHDPRAHSSFAGMGSPGLGSSQEEPPAPTMAQGMQSHCCAHPILTMEFIPSQPLPNTSTSSPFPSPRVSQFSPTEKPNSALKPTKIPKFQLLLHPPKDHGG